MTEPPRFWRQLAVLSTLLALLFAALQPPSTAHLGFAAALLAWLLHIGTGMACAVSATWGLLRALPPLRRHPWPSVVLGGVVGGLLFAPVALGLEALFPAAPPEPADDWLDAWEQSGGIHALLAEYLSLLPSYLAAWLLVNAPPMLRVGHPQLALPGDVAFDGLQPQAGVHLLPARQENALLRLPAPSPTTTMSGPAAAGPSGAAVRGKEGLLERLPVLVGQQLVSISADLHYLHVTTRRGRATVLGSLAEAEVELAERGLRIHRSHWVALEAIKRMRRTSAGLRCELVDGRSLPVSRRRASDVKQRLGTDFVLVE